MTIASDAIGIESINKLNAGTSGTITDASVTGTDNTTVTGADGKIIIAGAEVKSIDGATITDATVTGADGAEVTGAAVTGVVGATITCKATNSIVGATITGATVTGTDKTVIIGATVTGTDKTVIIGADKKNITCAGGKSMVGATITGVSVEKGASADGTIATIRNESNKNYLIINLVMAILCILIACYFLWVGITYQ